MFARNAAKNAISWTLHAIRRSAEGRGMLTRVYSDKNDIYACDYYSFWIKKDNDPIVNIGRAACSPVYSNPNVRFQINGMEDFQAFHALAYCNIHGLWRNSLER